jgi:hypothetical protein
MEKRGLDKSKAIQVAIGVVQNWATGRGDVKPEVRAAAAAAVAQWEAAKAKAKATPNKGEVKLSQEDAEAIELSAVGKAFRFRHGWIPVDEHGNDLPMEKGVPKAIARDRAVRAHAEKLREAGDHEGAIAHLEEARKNTKSPALAHGLDSTIAHYKRSRDLHGTVDIFRDDLAWENEQDRLHQYYRDQEDARRTQELSQPMALLRSVLDGSEPVELAQIANEPTGKPSKGKAAPPAKGKGKPKDDQYQKGRHQLPPGATGWKHGWVPVNSAGQPVGPSQENKSSQEIKDMVGHDAATKDAIKQAYQNKAQADAKKAAKQAASNKKKAAAAAKRAAKQKAAAVKKALAARAKAAKQKASAAAKAKTAATKQAAAKRKAHQQLVSQATKLALADKKAGRPLTPSQQRLLDAFEAQQKAQNDQLRNNVNLSQPMALIRSVLEEPATVELGVSADFGGGSEVTTVPTVTSQDGGRFTSNSLVSKASPSLVKKAVKARRSIRKKGKGTK